jgi:hypothetical protein
LGDISVEQDGDIIHVAFSLLASPKTRNPHIQRVSSEKESYLGVDF